MRMRRHAALVGLFTFGVLAGCSDSSGPDTDFDAADAEQIAAEVENVASAVEAPDDALQSLQLASAALGFGAGFDVAAAIPGEYRIAPAALWEIGSIGPAALIPSNYLGVTFVWDETEQWYVPSDRTGAPANGVRVVYYAMDPVTEMPVSPLQELGYVDLADEGTAESERLGITVVSTSGDSNVTLADYYLDISWEETATSFTVNASAVGFISDGTNQLDFDLNQSVSGSETSGLSLTMDHTLSLPGQDVSVNFTASGTFDLQTEEMGDLDVTFTIQNGADTMVLEATVSTANGSETIEGTIKYNGEVVANISGSPENPTFTKPDGTELTQQEVAALERIFEGISNVFEFVENIFV